MQYVYGINTRCNMKKFTGFDLGLNIYRAAAFLSFFLAEMRPKTVLQNTNFRETVVHVIVSTVAELLWA